MTKPPSYPVEVVTELLSPEEETDRLRLERKVESAFYEAGKALQELRDRRLYRNTHHSFEAYVKERFGFGRSRSSRLIDAVTVVENLIAQFKMLPNGQQNESKTNRLQILPTNERQVRPLTSLEAEQQREAWAEAVTVAQGKQPSNRVVKSIVERIKERTNQVLPNPFHLGEVCRIIVKEAPELKGKSGLIAIITQVHEFSCTVKTYRGALTVRRENLDLLDYSSRDCSAMDLLCDRLAQVYSEDLEKGGLVVLDFLGKLDRPYLTPLEEKLLQALETEVVTTKLKSR